MHNELVVSKAAIISMVVDHYDAMLIQMHLKFLLSLNCFVTSEIMLMMNIDVTTEMIHKYCCCPILYPSELAFESSNKSTMLTLKLVY
eukprot:7257514-Ditylum_brightwellii.AAC.1